MSIHFRIESQNIIVFGNTYPHKDQIKALGARFNGADKTWVLPNSDDTREKVELLCQGHGGGQLAAASPMKSELPLRREPVAVKAPPENSLSISDLMNKVQTALTQAFPVPVWIVGEVQNISKKPSAVFLNIAEPKREADHSSTVAVKATLWRTKLNEILTLRGKDLEDLLLVDGTEIRLLAQVQLYKDRGHITLNILDLDPSFTKGALALAREKLLRELRQKGLDQANKKLRLTAFPFRVGLISAEGSRAHSDFMDQLREYKFPGEVLFESAQMQGEQVPAAVSSAIQRLQAKDCDVIVVTRGGGSAADLRWFDDRAIAYAIAEAKIPIIAAIGHHEDVCIAEEICYLRQKTPTAAADFIVHHFELTKRRIDENAQHIALILQRRVEFYEQIQARLPEILGQSIDQRWQSEMDRLARFTQKIADSVRERLHVTELILRRLLEATLFAATQRLQAAEKTVDRLQQAVTDSVNSGWQSSREMLLALESQIKGLDPRPWLAKGWTQLLFADQRKVKSVKDVRVGEQARAVLLDGVIDITIDAIQEREK